MVKHTSEKPPLAILADACKPYDWIRKFPPVVQSSKEERQKIIDKWPEIFK